MQNGSNFSRTDQFHFYQESKHLGLYLIQHVTMKRSVYSRVDSTDSSVPQVVPLVSLSVSQLLPVLSVSVSPDVTVESHWQRHR